MYGRKEIVKKYMKDYPGRFNNKVDAKKVMNEFLNVIFSLIVDDPSQGGLIIRDKFSIQIRKRVSMYVENPMDRSKLVFVPSLYNAFLVPSIRMRKLLRKKSIQDLSGE